MSEISLTASMRSNLLSLQQISKLQDSTQLRLSTGLKVNSAIDNPSSYYTASSLTNRAEDLSALLDSMGQSIQTIKAATEGIEKAEDLLSQMKAIAEQVNTGTYVPEKSYFEELVGAHGAVVTNAEELRAAVDSGKEEICVYGKIDLGDISTTGGISLKENQKLVGVNYYGNYGTEGESFSSLSATSSVADKHMVGISKNGCLVSDLSLNYVNTDSTNSANVLVIKDQGVSADLQNLDIKADFADIDSTSASNSAIYIINNSNVNIKGNLNINVTGKSGRGIFSSSSASFNFASKAKVSISTQGEAGYGIVVYGSTMNIASDATIEVNTSGKGAIGLFVENSGIANIGGNLKFISNSVSSIYISRAKSNNIVNISSSAKIYLNGPIYNSKDSGIGANFLEIEKGAKLAFEKDGAAKWYEVQDEYKDKNDSGADKSISADNVETTLNVAGTSSWQTPSEIKDEEKAEQEAKEAEEQANREVYQKQFNNALSQYDSLIKDSSYKGVNLLQADDLKVIFNENRSSTLEVSGVDLSSDKIGMMTADWSKAKDVQTSLDQIINAKNTLRSASTKLGNYYSIITERETFTDNLINVLQEGADKLTLADMNEESANMLSLQTRQQLAINSLSLASQSSQSILRLF